MITIETRSAIDAALARADRAEAARLAIDALRKGQRDALLFRLGAQQCAEAGDHAGAHALLADALRLAPADPDVLTDIAGVWRRIGNHGEALRILDALIDRGLDHAPTWLEHGYSLHARGAFRAAHDSYRRAAQADPTCVDALAAIAETAVQLGDRDCARAFAEQALAIDPDNIVAAQCLAQLELDKGDFAAARTRLTALLGTLPPDSPPRVQTLSLLGDALDGLDETAGAFRAYSDAKTAFRRLHAPRFGDETRGQRALINHVRKGLAKVLPQLWRRRSTVAASAARNHIFLLGYPRSGTTLVENVLASLPDVVALEERPTLAATERPLLGSADGLEQLARIDQTTADHHRRLYWQSVASFGGDVRGKTFVDMDPLKGISLPIIARLFPQARVVIMRRDPRDVVWSCFRRNFHITPAAYEFSDLKSAALHYDAMMALTQDCLDRLPLNAFVLRYDALVKDFDAETRRLCAFVGLDWSERVGQFARTAEGRGVATASVRQVTRGLFDGTNQWHRYRKELAPILPILQPWIERFGFSD